jgi:type IV secretory pathway ATPase VirB11/archaellum biosynthesis ATPase
MSPDAKTGTSTSETSSAVSAWSASPVYICTAERGCRVSAIAPTSTSRGPSSSALREPFLTPRRSLTVTGTETASATAAVMRQARSASSSSEAPEAVFVTLRTGQPMLRSTMSAPAATHMRAASAHATGSEPKTWTASGCSSCAMRR